MLDGLRLIFSPKLSEKNAYCVYSQKSVHSFQKYDHVNTSEFTSSNVCRLFIGEPHRKSKGKKMKESRKNAGDTTDGSRKKKRDRKTGREETSPGNNEGTLRESEGNKGDVAKKKKKKDKARVELDLSRVKREPQADSDSEITTRKSEENFRIGRKRTSEINCADKREGREDANGVSPAKKRKDVARESMKAVKIKRELFSPERSPKSFSKGRQSDANISGVNYVDNPHDGVDLKRVKREPKETPKKSKKYRK